MNKLYASIATALTLAFAAPAQAVPLSYATPGIENAVQYDFVAATTGNVFAYFAGSSAGYQTELALLVNGVGTGIQGLNNHKSAYGQLLDFGSVNAGDRLVFKLVNVMGWNVDPFYSDRTMNSDGLGHIYSANYGGDGAIPAGIAIGFEDLHGGGDFDYDDENFVVTNVVLASDLPQPSDVPEPASVALLLAGAAGLAASRRAKRTPRA